MIRGTFANIRLRNQLAPGTEGGFTRDFTADGDVSTVYDASVRYAEAGTPLVVLAGKEYGSGSSRDWAAKGTALLGVKVVIAESYERIHRSNLIGMGVLPLQYPEGENAESLGLTGEETFSFTGITALNDGEIPCHSARACRRRRVRRPAAHRHPRRGVVLPQRRHHAVRPALVAALTYAGVVAAGEGSDRLLDAAKRPACGRLGGHPRRLNYRRQGASLTTIDAAQEPFVASKRLRVAGWALHAYTASGTVLALAAVTAAMDGNAVRALWILLAALVIDGTDGMLARRLRVKETIPGFDGARLDDIVDYITYAFAPMVLLWTGNYLPGGTWGACVGRHSAACLELSVLPHRRQDRRPLLPGLPQLLERRRLLCRRARRATLESPLASCWPARCWCSCPSSTSTPPAPRCSVRST
jgi:hypothetical protein